MPEDAQQYNGMERENVDAIFRLDNRLFFLRELQDETELRNVLGEIGQSIIDERDHAKQRKREREASNEVPIPSSEHAQSGNESDKKTFVDSSIEFLRKHNLLKTNEGDKKLRLEFVGLMELRIPNFENYPRLVFVEPKFFVKSSSSGEMSEVLKTDHITILRAILRYGKEKDKSPFSSGQFDELMISGRLWKWLTLLWDWMEHGTYRVEQPLLEENGDGEINWEETISQKLPFLQNGRPIYMEYLTQGKIEDSSHYITRLHECLVSQCYEKLNSIGLADALGLVCENIYDSELSDFGEKEYILSRLNGELGNQFITAKRNTLTLMKAVIDEEFESSNDLNAQFLGMKSFHSLWETAIKKVFGDQIDLPINNPIVGLQNDRPLEDPAPTFATYIEPPQWNDATPTEKKDGEGSRLKPDFVAVREHKGKRYLVILDAKYYLPQFTTDNKKIDGQPGVGDVNKQFLYQLAYKGIIKKYHLMVKNAFIFPQDNPKDDENQSLNSTPFADIKVTMFEELFQHENSIINASGNIDEEPFPTKLKSYKINGLTLLRLYTNNIENGELLNIFIDEKKPQQTNEANAASPSS